MGLILESLLVPLLMDTKDYENGIDRAKKEGNSLLNGLSAIGGGVVTAGIGLAGAGIAGLTGLLVDSTKGAMEAEKIQAQLNAVLESTGGKAGMTADSINDLATSLSKVTPFEDDVITSGQNMLLTFTNIGKNVFPQTTETMLNMSQAMGTDLQSSAIQLGKALNDPTNGISALSRVGVAFTDEQKKMIETLQKAGDIEGAQKIILAELNTEFGNVARSAGKTASGGLTILKNNLGNIKDMVGAKIIPVVTDLAGKFSTWLSEPATQTGITNLVNGITSLATTVITNIPVVIGKFQEIVTFFQNNEGIVVGILGALGVAVASFAITTAVSMATALAPMLPIIAVMGLVGVAVYALYQAWKTNFGGIQEKSKIVFDFLKGIFNGFLPVINFFVGQFKLIISAFTAAFQGDWTKFGEILRQGWDNAWKAITGIINTAINFIKGIDWGKVGRDIILGLGNGIGAMAGWLSEVAKNVAKNALSAIKGFFGIKSPSTVFNLVGQNMMKGLSLGISENSGLVTKSINGVSQNIQASVNTNVSSGNEDVVNAIRGIPKSQEIDYAKLARVLAVELAKVSG